MCRPSQDQQKYLAHRQLTANTRASLAKPSLAKPSPDRLNFSDLWLSECLMSYATEVCGSLLHSLLVAIDNWHRHHLSQPSHIIEDETKTAVGTLVCCPDPTFTTKAAMNVSSWIPLWKLFLEKSCLSPNSPSQGHSPDSVVAAVREGVGIKGIPLASKRATLKSQWHYNSNSPSAVLCPSPLIGIIPQNTLH